MVLVYGTHPHPRRRATALRLFLCAAALAAAGGLVATPARSDAAAEYRAMRSDMQRAGQANDAAATLAATRRYAALAHGSPNAQLQLARSLYALGAKAEGLAALHAYLSLGLALPAGTWDAWLAAAVDAGTARALRAASGRNSVAHTRSGVALVLPAAGLVAEDVDADPRRHRHFVTTVRGHSILAVGSDGTTRRYASSPDGWPMMAVRVDAGRGLLWATEVALEGFAAVAPGERGRSALLAYDLADGRLVRRIEGAPGSALADMALGQDGDLVISDGAQGRVYMLRAGADALVRIDAGDFVSPQTPALLPDGRRAFIPDYVRGVALMDLATGAVRWLDGGDRHALAGIDGLYWRDGRLLAVQNGTDPERVVEFSLDASLTRVTGERVIESATPTLGDPTHGVVVGADFYYLARSGWENLDDAGEPVAGRQVHPPLLVRTTLR